MPNRELADNFKRVLASGELQQWRPLQQAEKDREFRLLCSQMSMQIQQLQQQQQQQHQQVAMHSQPTVFSSPARFREAAEAAVQQGGGGELCEDDSSVPADALGPADGTAGACTSLVCKDQHGMLQQPSSVDVLNALTFSPVCISSQHAWQIQHASHYA